MLYMKSNGKYAVPVAGLKDVELLNNYGVVNLAAKANKGCLASRACIQRLVNSNYLAEGSY